MVPILKSTLLLFVAALLIACKGESAVAATVKPADAAAVEATIRKVLAERIPNFPKIDEIRASPVPGLYEVRFAGTEIVYVDASGQYLLQGALVDTKTMDNLTEQRIDKLTAVDFKSLPVQDAVVIKQGDGSRKLAVFADPNCGYCKRFERDLQTLTNVTIYTYLMPILGPDSTVKSRDIWCAKDAAKAWRAWMVDNVVPEKAAEACKAETLARNVALGRKHRINGTPALVFEDGTRKPGALPAKAVEELLAAAGKKS
jgi:thiol:disulfide interchange protein DsbC